MFLLSFNENKININLFIYDTVCYKIFFFLFLPGSSHTDDPGKYKKSFVS